MSDRGQQLQEPVTAWSEQITGKSRRWSDTKHGKEGTKSPYLTEPSHNAAGITLELISKYDSIIPVLE